MGSLSTKQQQQEILGRRMTEILEQMKSGRFEEAEQQLEACLEIDFEHADVISALKYVKFWGPRAARLETITDVMERGEYLFREWVNFLNYLRSCDYRFEGGTYACRLWLFSSALASYQKALRNSAVPDPDVLFRMGRCLKSTGDYERAAEFLESARQSRREDAEIIAELADCYAFLNETKAAKAFFREAFFINPLDVDINFIESELIVRLIERIRILGYSGNELKVWLPVYAVLYGVFNIKRELRPLEYGRLKQAIYSLETELREQRDEQRRALLVPELLNRYFWLIDHYIGSKDSRENVEEVLRKIKLLDESVYEQFTT
ncbi:tetratricopeptide repeat protein [Sediminispirochaeta bajacaliforniensis]|uniref:tetratricopeptide repeat protein n=1 Tax=Sediminispirochaeta bajacaliforniensis TaxID=148 RepID=UPI0003653FA1|nr:tetratricopeptide repeat protein [Sediminispirochaeta bajacaliforniensis]